MGIARLSRIVDQLIDSGMAPDTPAVVVQAASTGLQRSVHASLRNIVEECRRQNLKPPALVIIGESVRNHLNDPENAEKSLAGKKVLLTGSARDTETICGALRESGAEPVPCPIIVRRRFDDSEGWDRFLAAIERKGVCIFQNAATVVRFFEGFMLRGRDIRELSQFKMAVMGKETEAALWSHGIRADAFLADLEAKTLQACLSNLFSTSDFSLVWLHRNPSPPFPAEGIGENCLEIIPLTVEMESVAEWDARWKDGLLADPPDFIVFTGNSEVVGFVELLEKETAFQLALKSCVVAINKAVAEILENYGLPCKIALNAPGTGNLIDALAKYTQ
jgi:uroporphyrinogen III methyltransferase/synthase